MNLKNRSRLKTFGLFLSASIIGWSTIGCEKDTEDPVGPGDTTATFNTDLYNLRLTEIHYNPSDLDDNFKSDSLEFIEIKNTGSTALNVGGLTFTDGIDYVFPDSTFLQPDGFFVIASSENGFKQRYGVAPDGVYIGVLKNGGETITLMDAGKDSIISSQFYSDTEEWPQEADGDGYSLVTVKAVPDLKTTGPAVWRKSARMHGSPGTDDIVVAIDPTLFNLRITEMHYNPLDLDATDGDSVEFIEFKNVGSTELALGRVEFTNGVIYAFPADAKLAAGGFLVLTSNIEKFKLRYPDVTPFGVYTDNLSNTGEKVVVTDVDADTNLIVIDFKDSSPWPAIADGEGYSMVTVSINPDRNQDNAGAWRRSFLLDGSPGADDPGVVVINEVLTHTDPPDTDAIELYNPGDNPVNIGGWYLTDDHRNPMKFKIPDNTVIPAGGYIVFDETQFNVDSTFASFTLDSHGEEVLLVASERGCTQEYCHGFEFGELENGVSLGRHITSTGKEVFVPQKNKTLGFKNAGPRLGPLVISEIMYHSLSDAGDFIEITNISGDEVKLSHPDNPDTTWRVSGIGFRFPANSVIKANESVIIGMDSMSVASLRGLYTIPAEVQIFINAGGLKNGDEMLELLKPEDPYAVDTAQSVYPYMLFDEVEYADGGAWPPADGNGLSLHRKADSYGDDPASWEAANPTPGKFGK